MKLSLASACCNSAHLANFLMLVTFDVMQDKDLPCSGRQRTQRRRYVHAVSVTRRY